MITVFNIGHSFDYEVQKLIGIFYPYEKLKVLNDIENVSGQSIECKAESLGGIINISVKADLLDGYSEHNTAVIGGISDKKCEENLCGALFKCLKDITGYSPAWGMLTGIRPAKLFLRLFFLLKIIYNPSSCLQYCATLKTESLLPFILY